MKKLRLRFVLLVGLIVLLLALGVTRVEAQDYLPWTVSPGGNSETSEFHTYTPQDVFEGQCIFIDLTIGVSPQKLRLFVEDVNQRDRYSKEISTAPGQRTLCVPLTELGLEDSGSGTPDHSRPFNPTIAQRISDLGVHGWDGAKRMNFRVDDLHLAVPDVQPVEVDVHIPEGDLLCLYMSEDIRDGISVFFSQVIEGSARLFTIVDGMIVELGVEFQTFLTEGGQAVFILSAEVPDLTAVWALAICEEMNRPFDGIHRGSSNDRP